MIPRLLLLLVSMMLVTSAVLRSAKSVPPAGGLLVVANQKEHTLLVVDPDNRRELAKIAVGVNGHEVIVSKDSRFAYVPIYGNSGVGKPGTDGSTIDVIDLQERKLAATIDLGKPLRPHRAEFGPDGLLYVTAELADAVDVIDPSTRKVLAEIPTGEPQSHMLVLSRDGRRGYTANVSAGTRMRPASRSSMRPRTKSQTGSNCRMWRMRRRRLPMGAGCSRSAWQQIVCTSLICKR